MIRKRSVILFGAFLFVTWNAILVLLLWPRDPGNQPEIAQRAEIPTSDLMEDVLRMADAFEVELELQKNILLQIRDERLVTITDVLLFCCHRFSALH